jgi:chemotaxis protein histidine kinase CheA
MDDMELQLKRDFLIEAQEMIENCEQSFIDLERNPSDKKVIDNIFRLVHTIKGSGYAAGFDSMAKFVHEFEAVLSRIRADELELSKELVDVLLSANDMTKNYLDALADCYDAVLDTASVTDALSVYIPQKTADTSGIDFSSGFGFFDDEPAPAPVAVTPVAAAPVAVPTSATSVARSSSVVASGSEQEVWDILRRKPTVLVCDDEPDLVELLSMTIEDLGVTILKAYNGEEALNLVKNNRVDTIVTDLKMPKMDGLQFIREVSMLDKKIPVIFCSGFADRAVLVQFIKIGAFAFIEKPFESEIVVATVRRALKMRALEDAVQKLSVLNFRAYMLASQLQRFVDPKHEQKAEMLKTRLEKELDSISRLSNYVLEEERSKPAVEKKSA